ncbi:alpha/beta fold hydrolase [Pseudoduganella sp. UC29_106]|uniref:alpha/beta fold hydrolase n=1 Tax=Pseudoduganella sp. UC29_106 TaxID=3374553 RepID=UPI00375742C3
MFKQTIAALLFAATIPAFAATAFKAEVSGSGQPVILIPGLASSGEVWKETAAHLCGPRQCHVLTLAGFAGQPALQEGELIAAAEQQLADYITANRLDKPVVIGHSMGGFLALKLASDHPDKVGRLVIVDALPALGATAAPNATPEQLQAMAVRMRDGMAQQDAASYAAAQQRAVAGMVTSPAHAERISDWGKASDRATVTNAMYSVMATDMRGDIARIKAPTLVLGTWVAFKAFAPKEAIEATYRMQYAKLPGARIELADTARHFMMYDEPDWMYARIDQFLK